MITLSVLPPSSASAGEDCNKEKTHGSVYRRGFFDAPVCLGC